jgi:hypothetical protein
MLFFKLVKLKDRAARTCSSYQDSFDRGLLIRYARTCGSYQDSLDRGLLIRDVPAFVAHTRIPLTLYQGNPGKNHKFWDIGSTALYQGNPGRNHKFWHIESTALYQGNPGRNHKFWHIGSTSLYQRNPDRGLLIRQNLWFVPGFPS